MVLSQNISQLVGFSFGLSLGVFPGILTIQRSGVPSVAVLLNLSLRPEFHFENAVASSFTELLLAVAPMLSMVANLDVICVLKENPFTKLDSPFLKPVTSIIFDF